MPGRLVLVATPIGNLDDLSPRCAAALASADLLCCEDTRRTAKLYSHLGLPRPRTVVVNEHTEAAEVGRIVTAIASGATVALVSDAGMPAISDPGERVVAAVVAAGLEVTAVPGPSAVLTALAISGLATGRFVMEGFLARSGPARRRSLEALSVEPRTIVLFEAPHRLVRTLDDLCGHLGSQRRVAVARELTKVYEEVHRSDLGGAAEHFRAVEPRGEFVIVVEGLTTKAAPPDDSALCEELQGELSNGSSRRDAIDAVAGRHGVARKRVYALALALPATS